MTETILSIRHWGKALGLRLPQALVHAAQLQADQQVRVSLDAGRVVIEPLAPAPLSLEERLQRYDPVRHGGELMSTPAVGAEKW